MVDNVALAIILVNYKGYCDTLECVESIRESTFKNYQIIIVENASGDKSRFLEDTYLNETADILYLDKNRGFAGGNNYAIKYAIEHYSPSYILLLNNDTIVEKHAIERLVEGTIKCPDAGIITGKINYYDKKDIIWAAQGKFSYKTGIADQPYMGKADNGEANHSEAITFASGCLMLIPNEVISKVGYLDESYFMYAEDTDYCCRVMNAGYLIYYAANARIYHKVSASVGNNSKLQQYYMFRNNCYIAKKYCTFPLYGYIRRFYRAMKEMRRNGLHIGIIFKAWKDFRRGVTGKVEI